MSELTTNIDNNSNAINKPVKRKMSFLKKLMLWAMLLFVLYLGVVYLLGAVLVYSKGDRTGYIYKFSKKGYVFKTYEGILKTGFVNIGNTSTPNEEWTFSVDDDKVADEIKALDQRTIVKLHYKEHYVKLFWRGDTKYFVDKIEVLPAR
jgi:hypothetical protein